MVSEHRCGSNYDSCTVCPLRCAALCALDEGFVRFICVRLVSTLCFDSLESYGSRKARLSGGQCAIRPRCPPANQFFARASINQPTNGPTNQSTRVSHSHSQHDASPESGRPLGHVRSVRYLFLWLISSSLMTHQKWSLVYRRRRVMTKELWGAVLLSLDVRFMSSTIVRQESHTAP